MCSGGKIEEAGTLGETIWGEDDGAIFLLIFLQCYGRGRTKVCGLFAFGARTSACNEEALLV